MSAKDLTWNFHKIMTDSTDNSQRLREFTRTLASKLCTHDLPPETRSDLTSEFELLSLLSMLFDYEIDQPFSTPSEHNSLQSQISYFVKSNKDFRLLLTLLNWTETIKKTEAFKYSDSSLIPEVRKTHRSACLDPDSVTKQASDYKVSLNKCMIDCFWLIRSGKLAKAQDLLRSHGAGWMALTLGGLCPYFNSQLYIPVDSLEASFTDTIDSQLPRNEHFDVFEYGNINIALYMKTCWALSNNKDASVAEKALFGSFCGNFDAIVEMCENNVHDFFWAQVRTLFIFRFKEMLSDFDDNFKCIEDCEDQVFGMPSKAPSSYPVSLENILQRVQKRFGNEFLKFIVNLQFTLIAVAVKGQKKEYLDRLVNSRVPENYLRVIVHAFVCFKNTVSDMPTDLYSRFDDLLLTYLHSISEDYADIEIVVFYLRYFSFNNNIYLGFFKYLFSKYPEEYSHRKIIEQLKIYSKDHFQSIISQVALNQLEFPYHFNQLDSLITVIDQQSSTEGFSERLIRAIPLPITEASLPSIIKVIKELAFGSKIKLGQMLLSKTYNAKKDSGQDFDLRYLGNFFISLETYSAFYKAKHADHSFFAQKSQTSNCFEALQKLDSNPTLLMERHIEKCRQIAEQLQYSLEEVTGVNYRAFPLRENSEENVKLKEKWWSWMIAMLVEAYAELRKREEIENLKVLVEELWGRAMVEDQRTVVLRKIEEKLRF